MAHRSVKAAMLATTLATTLAVSACGVTYISPTVQSQTEGLDVRVIAITAETALLANRQPYAPRSLPGYFREVAGTGGGLRGSGALPEAPVFPDAGAPQNLELRVPPPVVSGPYLIGVGDVIRLATRGQTDPLDPVQGASTTQDLRQEYTVRDDGAVAVPEIGAIQIAGTTIDVAEERIFQRMIESGINPTFSVEVSGFNSQRVSIGGAVGSATILPLGLTATTLNEGLTRAGGVAASDPQYAAIRLYRDGTLYQIPLETYLARDDLQRLRLVSGDSVFVDTTYDLDRALSYYESQISIIALRRSDRAQALGELQSEIGLRSAALSELRGNFQARTALGAEARDYVYLAGEVSNQARWPLPYDQQSSLADVLYDNGGFSTATGNPAQIYILRASTNPAEFGAVTAWHLDARNAANLTLAARIQLRPHDIIFIEEQPITRWNRAFQQFFPTLINTAAAAIN